MATLFSSRNNGISKKVRIGYDKLSYSIKNILEKNGCRPSEYIIDFLKQCFQINGILPAMQKIKYFLEKKQKYTKNQIEKIYKENNKLQDELALQHAKHHLTGINNLEKLDYLILQIEKGDRKINLNKIKINQIENILSKLNKENTDTQAEIL